MSEARTRRLAGLDWEAAFAPYDDDTYRAALAFLRRDDVVLDIGAGDMRFARQAAQVCRRVIAIERNPALVALGATRPLPWNLDVLCADALTTKFPPGVTVGVLLMRHCRHYLEYTTRLWQVGCRRLATNARWGMGVEEVVLDAPCRSYQDLASQWYACQCGSVGFAPGPPELIDVGSLMQVVEVTGCPACKGEPKCHLWKASLCA